MKSIKPTANSAAPKKKGRNPENMDNDEIVAALLKRADTGLFDPAIALEKQPNEWTPCGDAFEARAGGDVQNAVSKRALCETLSQSGRGAKNSARYR